MSLHRVSRKYHKWLMLFIGMQFVVWAFSGAYMVSMDIDYIHGDSLITKQKNYIDSKQINYSVKQLLTDNPSAKNVALVTLLNQVIYRFTLDGQTQLASAEDGKLLPPVTADLAVKIAKQAYASNTASIVTSSLIAENPPRELSARYLPVWRIEFDDFASPTFYVSVNSAKIVTKRHDFWRIFDWMFAFHVMDYVDEEADNLLLFMFTLLAILASIFGAVLTYFRVIKVRSKLSTLPSKNNTLESKS